MSFQVFPVSCVCLLFSITWSFSVQLGIEVKLPDRVIQWTICSETQVHSLKLVIPFHWLHSRHHHKSCKETEISSDALEAAAWSWWLITAAALVLVLIQSGVCVRGPGVDGGSLRWNAWLLEQSSDCCFDVNPHVRLPSFIMLSRKGKEKRNEALWSHVLRFTASTLGIISVHHGIECVSVIRRPDWKESDWSLFLFGCSWGSGPLGWGRPHCSTFSGWSFPLRNLRCPCRPVGTQGSVQAGRDADSLVDHGRRINLWLWFIFLRHDRETTFHSGRNENQI